MILRVVYSMVTWVGMTVVEVSRVGLEMTASGIEDEGRKLVGWANGKTCSGLVGVVGGEEDVASILGSGMQAFLQHGITWLLVYTCSIPQVFICAFIDRLTM